LINSPDASDAAPAAANADTPSHPAKLILPSKEPQAGDPIGHLRQRLNQLRPWRMSIQVTNTVSTGEFIDFEGKNSNRCQQSRDLARDEFLHLIDRLFPNGLAEQRLLDCGCNAAAYCFWARERNAELAFGFDVREHWIKQARLVKYFRDVASTERIQLEILRVEDLGKWSLDPFDIVLFKGIFYHLADPIHGLKLAGDLSRDILIFSTAFLWDRPDGHLALEHCPKEILHGGIETISWFPTGPKICADLIRNLGFEQIKLLKVKQTRRRPERGRLELVAARVCGRLDAIEGEEI
jgi:hypothetical protein